MEVRKSNRVNQKKDGKVIRNKIGSVKLRIPVIHNLTTIRFKLVLSFLIPIGFIIFLGIVSYNKAADGIRSSYEHSTKQAIHMTSKYLQLGMDGAEALSVQYQNDDNIKKYFMGINKDDILASSNNYKAILNSMIAKEATDDFVSQISILSDTVNSVTTASSVQDNICAEFFDTEEGKSLGKSLNTVWVGSNSYLDEKLGIGPEEYSLRLLRNVMGSDSLIVIDIDDKTVRDILKDMQFDPTGIIGMVTADGKEIISEREKNDGNSVFIEEDFYKKAVSSELISDAYYVDYQGIRNLFLYSKVGETGSMICAVIPKSTILSQADSIRTLTVIIVIIACIIAVLTGLFISNGIDKTIKYIISKLKKVSNGDLTITLSTNRKDEFRILIDEINHTFVNMKELVSQVKVLSVDVSEASVNVATTSEEFVTTTGDISVAMNEIEQGVMQQAKDSQECLEQMDNLSNKITFMSDNTSKIGNIAEGTKKSIQEGTIATSNLNDQTKSTKEITSVIVKEIENLAEKSKSIDSIINVINDISNQTNLLSLNASIEAARAGEVGKGFAVVAGEIRNLADQTRNSVNDIKNIIKSIQENTKNAVITAKKAEDVMSMQDTAVKNTTSSYLCINESVDDLMIHLQNIIENVSDIEDARVSTLGAIENISAVLEEIAASTNNVNHTSSNQLVSVDTLNHWANNLNKNSVQLVQAIQKFTV